MEGNRNREGKWGVGVAEVPDKQISSGKTDNYPMWSRWSIYISVPSIFTIAARARGNLN